jgi:hypothetical protein
VKDEGGIESLIGAKILYSALSKTDSNLVSKLGTSKAAHYCIRCR